jgi:putative SOS response-associated peptidase YedK
MCGRYTDTRRNKTMLARLGVEADLDFTPRYNIAPTQDAWIVTQSDDGTRILKRARWGLIPFWAKDEKIGNSLVNARSDSVATKPAFRSAYKKKRCLVLADGFYEWQKMPTGEQPFYIRVREGGPFAFGGLWERWGDAEKWRASASSRSSRTSFAPRCMTGCRSFCARRTSPHGSTRRPARNNSRRS